MAPKKAANKREQPAARGKSAPAAKKAKAEAKPEPKPQAKPEPKPEAKAAKPALKPKTDTKYTPIIEGINQSTDLTETCREMILSMIPHALSAASDERQSAQNVAVRMIGEALDDVVTRLQQALDAQNEKLAEADKNHDNLLVKVKDLEATLIEAAKAENDRKKDVADAAAHVADAKAALAEKQQVQKTEDAVLDSAEGDKAKITDAYENHFKILNETEVEGIEGTKHYQAMLPVINMLHLEQSLTTALPSTCAKSKGQRGTFDNMVMEQMGKSINDKLQELTTLLETGAVARQERADAVQVATQKFEEAKAVRCEKIEHLTTAQAALKSANDEVSAAKKSLEAYKPDHLQLTKARDAKAEELNNFKTYNIGSFELLRDRVAKRPPPPVASPTKDTVDADAISVQNSPVKAAAEEPADDTPSKADVVMESTSEAPTAVGGA